jgi:hypothetical protein
MSEITRAGMNQPHGFYQVRARIETGQAQKCPCGLLTASPKAAASCVAARRAPWLNAYENGGGLCRYDAVGVHRRHGAAPVYSERRLRVRPSTARRSQMS